MRTMTVPARKRGRPESPRSAAIRENMEEQSIRMFEVERLGALAKHSRRNLEMDIADNEPQRLVIKSLEAFYETLTAPELRHNLKTHIDNLKKAYVADLSDDQMKYEALVALERLHQLGVQAVEQLTLCNRQLERGELKHATDHSVHTGRT